jgi:colanic acid/amylovoran biosynthesis protein
VICEGTRSPMSRADPIRPISSPAGAQPVRICILGASFNTGNLGVNALAESTIQVVHRRWSEVEIVLLGSGRDPVQLSLPIEDRDVKIRDIPVRFSRNLGLPYHFLWFLLYGIVARILPWPGFHRRLFGRNPYCRALHEAHLAVDITGGDSFSDIYGFRRFVLGFARKWLVLLYGKKLVMMPQTYGPLQGRVARSLAKYVLRRSSVIYSRDRAGLEYLNDLMGPAAAAEKVRFAPDVAFVLTPREPCSLEIDGFNGQPDRSTVLVGLNVSGLIYYGGYTGRNEFGLAVDYRTLIDAIVARLLREENTRVLLVPHVIPAGGYRGNVENDLSACLEVYERCAPGGRERLLVARGPYDHREIKHIIGLCEFFIGTRMHSCVAALSQCIPAVGLAYSGKFRGVFDTVGVGEMALDLRSADEEEILAAVERAFTSRDATADHLRKTVPPVKRQVMSLLEDIGL